MTDEHTITPALLRALLDIYTTPDQQYNGTILEVLEGMELIVNEYGVPKVTQRGEAHILQVLRLPLPRKAWMSHDGKEITL